MPPLSKKSTKPATTVSANGIKLITEFEGIARKGGDSRYAYPDTNIHSEDVRKYYFYRDPIGLATIGIGHLITDVEKTLGYIIINGEKVAYKDGLTFHQVQLLKMQDIQRFVDGINNLVKVPLNQNQFDALVSLSLNIGLGNFGKSTLLKLLNAGNYAGAANEFVKWNRAGGKVVQGLVNRRKSEKALFEAV